MKKKLWTRNFTLVTVASALGAAGGIASEFALSFLVFDETGSTLAAALILAIQLIPGFIVPLVAAPWMDRLPRKPFLVGGDAVNALLYAVMGVYLLKCEFSYVGYLCFSLMLSSIGSFDRLAYESIYPKLIPAGMEQKGYSVSAMLYPVIQVVMLPLAAWLFSALGVAWLLIAQGVLSLIAAGTESFIRVEETSRMQDKRFSFRLWWEDVKETVRYLKKEKGLGSIFAYMAVTNGFGSGYSPLLIAFFRTAPGLSVAMFAFYGLAEFAGRSIGGALHYTVRIPPKKRFSFAFMVYTFYECMDMCLLWLPYPLMLVNRGVAGFLGINSATLRQAAVQRYIPETLRARINAFSDMLMLAAASVLSLVVGALGEVLDYRLCMTVCAAFCFGVCLLTIWRNRSDVKLVYNAPEPPDGDPAPPEAG